MVWLSENPKKWLAVNLQWLQVLHAEQMNSEANGTSKGVHDQVVSISKIIFGQDLILNDILIECCRMSRTQQFVLLCSTVKKLKPIFFVTDYS